MNPDLFKVNTLAIIAAGSLILLTGIALYFFRGQISGSIRFFMPIPPLAVAAYIFAFNMYNHFGGELPDGKWAAAREIIYGTLIAAIAFGLFTVLIVLIISLVKRQP
jgi:hypothetical protein